MARTREELDAVAHEAKNKFNGHVVVVVADVTQEDQVAAAVSEVMMNDNMHVTRTCARTHTHAHW